MILKPLRFINHVKAAVHDKGIQAPCFDTEARYTVAALLRGSEFELEERVISGADDAEVVRHFLPNF